MLARYYTGQPFTIFNSELMNSLMGNPKIPLLRTILSLALALVACAQPTPTATVSPLPSPTQTPAAPLVILLAAPESDPNLVAVASELASNYAASNGMQFEQRPLLNPAELPVSLAKLIMLAPDQGAVALASAAPQAQVIAIGFSPGGVVPNLLSIPLSGDDSPKIAFIAGYVAAISAEDWRTGMLYTGGDTSIVNDFVAGAEYFCGSCAPQSPPLSEYPVAAQATDAQNWQSAVDQLLAQSVRVVFLSPEMEANGAGQSLANSGILLIGNGNPSAELANSWIVSIASDSSGALRELLPLALNGQAIEPANSITFTNANPNLFGASRQANVQRVIDDLLTGYIQLPTD